MTKNIKNIFIDNITTQFICYCSEVEQNLANLIADRATDEVIEALTRYRRGLDISDNKIVHMDSAETPDIVRSRSSQDSMGFLKIRDSDLPHHVLDSPTVSLFSLANNDTNCDCCSQNPYHKSI